MFESLIVRALSKYLGDYIDGLDSENLNLKLTSGKLLLNNLRVKKDLLNSLDFPIEIDNGFIFQLEAYIPWHSLNKKPIIIRIEGVHIFLKPKSDSNINFEDELKRKQIAKTQYLQFAELFGLDTMKIDERAEKRKSGFFSRLETKITDNIQVFLENIHIRYDHDSNQSFPFYFGITLDYFHVQNTDSNWIPNFENLRKDIIYKMLDFKNLSLYLSSAPYMNTYFYKNSTNMETHPSLKSPIPETKKMQCDYLIMPVSATLKATVYRGEIDLKFPRLQIEIELEKIFFSLDSSQYKCIIDFLIYFSSYMKKLDYIQFKPPIGVTPFSNPRAYWKYVISSASFQVKKNINFWSWKNLSESIKNVNEYIKFYQKKLSNNGEISLDEKKRITNLEYVLNYDQIILLRKNISFRYYKALETKESAGKSGFLRIFNPNRTKIEKDQRIAKETYGTSMVQSEAIISETLPSDYVKNIFIFSFRSCSFFLKDEILDDKKVAEMHLEGGAVRYPLILDFQLRGFEFTLFHRESNISMSTSIENISIIENWTHPSTTIEVLKPNFARYLQNDKFRELECDMLIKENCQGKDIHFLTMNLDINPPNSIKPTYLRFRMSVIPLNLTFSIELINRIHRFFYYPRSVLLGRIPNISSINWKNMQEKAQKTLKYTLSLEKTYDIQVICNAPSISIPLNFTDPHCPAIIINLGNILFSNLNESQEEGKKIVDCYRYKKFSLRIQDINAMILGGKDAPWYESRNTFIPQYSIFDRFSLEVFIEVLFEPAQNSPKFRINSILESITMHIMDLHIIWVFNILNFIINSISIQMAESVSYTGKECKKFFVNLLGNLRTVPDKVVDNSFIEGIHSELADISYDGVEYYKFNTGELNCENRDPLNVIDSRISINFILNRFSIEIVESESLDIYTLLDIDKCKEYSVFSFPKGNTILILKLDAFKLSFHYSDQLIHMNLVLSSISIQDLLIKKYQNTTSNTQFSYLLQAGDFDGNIEYEKRLELIKLNYEGIPITSEASRGKIHFIYLNLGDTILNINRITVSYVLQIIKKISKYIIRNKAKMDSSVAFKNGFELLRTEESDPKNAYIAIISNYMEIRSDSEQIHIDENAISKNPDFVFLSIKMLLGTFRCNFIRENTLFFNISLLPSLVDINFMADGRIKILSKIDGFQVKFLSEPSHLENIVCMSQAKDTLNFEMVLFNKVSTDYPNYDMEFKAEINSIRFVFSHSFIEELKAYFRVFREIDHYVQVSSYYVSNVVRVLSESSYKYHLYLLINNPNIILANSSKSSDCVCLDLGKIIIENDFSNFQYQDETIKGLLLKNTNFIIRGLSAFITLNSPKSQKKIPIIDDLTVQTNIQTVIDKIFYDQEIPLNNVNIFINSFNMDFSQNNFGILINLLKDNILESIEGSEKELEIIKKHLNFKDTYHDGESGNHAIKNNTYIDRSSSYLKFQFHILLQDFKINFLGEKNSESTPFLLLNINNFILDLKINYDQKVNVTATFQKLILKEVDPESENQLNHIWDFYENVSGIEESLPNNIPSMLDFQYESIPETRFVKIRLKLFKSRFHLLPNIINFIYECYIDILTQIEGISSIIKRLNSKSEKIDSALDIEANNSDNKHAMEDNKEYTCDFPEILNLKEKVIGSKSSKINDSVATSLKYESNESLEKSEIAPVVVEMNSVEIELISSALYFAENCVDDNTTAFVLHLDSIKFNLIQTADDRLKISFILSNMSIYKCYIYAKNFAESGHNKILQPFNLGLNFSTRENLKSIAVHFGSTHAIIAHSDLISIIRVYSNYLPYLEKLKNHIVYSGSLNESRNELEKPDSEIKDPKVELDKSYNFPRQIKKMDSESQRLLEENNYGQGLEINIDRSVQEIESVITFDSLMFSLINDTIISNNNVPFVQTNLFSIDLHTKLYESKSIEALLIVETIELKVYNNFLGAFEPAIDPWEMNLMLLITPKGHIGLHLESQEILDLNLTKPLLDVIFEMVDFTNKIKETYIEIIEKKLEIKDRSLFQKSEEPRNFFHCFIYNQTGFPISYNILSKGDPHRGISDSSEEISSISHNVRNEISSYKIMQADTIDIIFPENSEYGKIRVPISKITTLYYLGSQKRNLKVDKKFSSNQETILVVDIKFEKGIKAITLRSNMSFQNNINHSMELKILSQDQSFVSTLELESGQKKSLPLTVNHFSKILVRPLHETYNYSSSELFKSDCDPHFFFRNSENCQTFVCATKQRMVSLDYKIHDYCIEFNQILTIENALVSDINISLINLDYSDILVEKKLIPRAECVKIYDFLFAEKEKYNFELGLVLYISGYEKSQVIKIGKFFSLNKIDESVLVDFKSSFNDPISPKSQNLTLCANIKTLNNSFYIAIYSKYWIINHTNLPLQFITKSFKNSRDYKNRILNSNFGDCTNHLSLFGCDPHKWDITSKVRESVKYPYAYNRYYFNQPKVYISVNDSAISKGFPLGIQTCSYLQIAMNTPNESLIFDFGISVEPAQGKFHRTKIVTIEPAYIMFNASSLTLNFRQPGSDQIYVLYPEEQTPFYRVSSNSDSEIILSVEGLESKPISLNITGTFCLPLEGIMKDPKLLDVLIKLYKSTKFIVFSDQSKPDIFRAVSYEIENHSSLTLSYQQQGSETKCQIEPNQSTELYWCMPQVRKSMLMIKSCEDIAQPMLIFLDEIAKYPQIPLYKSSSGHHLKFEVIANGLKKVLIINDVFEKEHIIGTKSELEKKARNDFKEDSIGLENNEKDVNKSFETLPRKDEHLDFHDLDEDFIPKRDNKDHDELLFYDLSEDKYNDFSENSFNVDSEKNDQTNELDMDFEGSHIQVFLQFKASLKGIGISLVDTTPQEIFYAAIETINIDYKKDTLNQSLEILVDSLQVDDKLYFTPYPVALFPIKLRHQSFLHLSLINDYNIKGINYFSYFGFQMQTIELNLTKEFLLKILDFFSLVFEFACVDSDVEKEMIYLQNNDDPWPSSIDNSIMKASDMYYFKLLSLNPIKIITSFNSNLVVDKEAQLSENLKITRGSFGFIFDTISILTNINNAPIKFNALTIENPYCSKQELIDRIILHYTSSIIKQFYIILGSADFLGNPLSFVSNIGTGVKDFFYEPAYGAVKSPRDFTRGLLEGTKSLISKTTFAVFDSAGKITNTVASLGAQLTFNPDYRHYRAYIRQKEAPNVLKGIVYGTRELGIGLYRGITGVVTDPIYGAKKGGDLGFIKGLGQGLAGLVLKPTIGTIDLISRTTEGIKNTTTSFDDQVKLPIRPIRYIREDKLLTVFNFQKSLGQELLRSLEERRNHRDIYIKHFILNDRCLIISRNHLFLLKRVPFDFGPQKWIIGWSQRLNSIQSINIKPKFGSISKIWFLEIGSLTSDRNKINRTIEADFDTIFSIYKKLGKMNIELISEPTFKIGKGFIKDDLMEKNSVFERSTSELNTQQFGQVPSLRNFQHDVTSSYDAKNASKDDKYDENNIFIQKEVHMKQRRSKNPNERLKLSEAEKSSKSSCTFQ